MRRDEVHVVGFSGGIDSQACARWVLNRYSAQSVLLLNSNAGGHEHELTTQFIEWYSSHVHQVIKIQPIVADMENRAKEKRQALGLADNDSLTFELLAQLKGRFPSRKAQFCTYHLKIIPQKRWMREHLSDVAVVRYTGLRRDESDKRKNTPLEEWDDFFDCQLKHPIADWTKQMCFDYVTAHGEQINPLYKLGANRVGCAPCINMNKEDVRMWNDRSPETIDKVRGMERRVGRTFYAPCVPGLAINWVDDVVAWSKTVQGGRQLGLDVLQERPACESKYGLCE